ncbi:MAG: aspartate--tRNA ligase [Caldilineaceae bacterium]
MLKSHTCGELTLADVGKRVTLAGWVNRRRDHGGLIFIDLRDRFGITQVTVGAHGPAHDVIELARNEYVLQVTGTVQRRPEGGENPNLPTGAIEVLAEESAILNKSLNPPFSIGNTGTIEEVDESVRLKYRYLDLRRPRMAQNLLLRHTIVRFIREYLSDRAFLEVETPILLKTTPEGARDFVVPSRLHPGEFYALPQSPQQLKQLLMVAGVERYFQIARCFRDEDLRADRQLEFTQLDLEMSFVDADDIRALIEGLLIELHGVISKKRMQQTPFPVITYADAMEQYGIDRPDLRFGQRLFNLTDMAASSEFAVFRNAVETGGQVKGVVWPGGNSLTRRELDELTEAAKRYGAKGLVWIGVMGAAGADGHFAPEAIRSQASKFLSPGEVAAIVRRSEAAVGDLILIIADKAPVVAQSLHNLRMEIGKRANLIDPNEDAFCWVVDFPLLEYHEEDKRWYAVHHPFTSARDADWERLESDPASVLAKAYDVVMNGWEVGGGSIRIHRSDLQDRLFGMLGMAPSEREEKFGHLLEAFQYGAPPHGGIALGIDRLVALFAEVTSIREVIAFPKTAAGTDLMLDTPSAVGPEQLRELSIAVALPPAKGAVPG